MQAVPTKFRVPEKRLIECGVSYSTSDGFADRQITGLAKCEDRLRSSVGLELASVRDLIVILRLDWNCFNMREIQCDCVCPVKAVENITDSKVQIEAWNMTVEEIRAAVDEMTEVQREYVMAVKKGRKN